MSTELLTKNRKQTRASALRASRAWYARNAEHVSQRAREKLRANPSKALFQRTRKRAAKLGLPFDLTPEDVVVPDVCPVLGIPFNIGDRKFGSSPSIDRVVPSLGYVRGNIVVCSQRANRIKNDATLSELRAVVAFLEARS